MYGLSRSPPGPVVSGKGGGVVPHVPIVGRSASIAQTRRGVGRSWVGPANRKITTNVDSDGFVRSRAHPKILDLAMPELSLPPFAPRQELPLYVGG